MKKLISNFIVILIILFISDCKQDDAPVPLKFKGYEGNPVLVSGEPGSWDELFVSAPQAIYHDSIFYLFYMGCNVAGKMGVGLATSIDGLHFAKHPGNPVLAPDDSGFDAYTASAGVIVEGDSGWVMYYNGNELATYAPGPAIGRAVAANLTGPWIRDESPVVTSGSSGEWDAGFIIPSSAIRMDDGSYRLYYTGGNEIATPEGCYTGMATSADGINWKKYNDPATFEHPFAGSDPVLMPGKRGEWDENYVWMANVNISEGGYRMYYAGARVIKGQEIMAIGYAESSDGIRWIKHRKNPVFTSGDDPSVLKLGVAGSVENPSILYLNDRCFMYYDFTLKQQESHAICVAITKVK